MRQRRFPKAPIFTGELSREPNIPAHHCNQDEREVDHVRLDPVKTLAQQAFSLIGSSLHLPIMYETWSLDQRRTGSLLEHSAEAWPAPW
jgi:hypothetical protein